MINNVVIMGRLTNAPELKSTMGGSKVTSFTVAVERKYKAAGEERQTDFIDCVAWNGTAEFITSYFNKGSMIAVIGNIQTRNYEDKNGNKRKSVEVVIENVSFCGSKSETSNQTAPAAANANVDIEADDFEEIGENDDVPF